MGKRGTPELKFPLYNTKKVIWKENARIRKETTAKSEKTAKRNDYSGKEKTEPNQPLPKKNTHNPRPTREANTTRHPKLPTADCQTKDCPLKRLPTADY